MSKYSFKLLMVLAVVTSLFAFNSCNKDESLTNSEDVSNFVNETVYNFQRDGNCGKFGCYEFVFPITIVFPDETTSEVESYDALKETLKAWKEANPDATERPSLSFPLEVVSEDGEIISVASREELRELARECIRGFFKGRGRPGHGKGDFCFKLVFPLSIAFPDGTTMEVEDRRDLRSTLREWKAANPDAEERPTLAFPITVEMEDGTQVSVESSEALQELKESCSADD